MASRPKMPKVVYPDPPPPAPDRSDSETAALAEQQRSRFFRRGGRASTFFGMGHREDASSAAMRFLSGGSGV